MKKILILLLLLTSSLTLSTNLYAWDLNDQLIPELNGHTLREVFEDGIIATVSELNVPSSVNAYTIATLSYPANTTFYVTRLQSVQMMSNTRNTFHIQYDDMTNVYQSNLTNYQMNVGMHSWVVTSTKDVKSIKFWPHTINPSPYLFTNIKVIEMTSLGISALTVEQMDKYHSQYISRGNANYDLDDTKATNVLTIMQDFQDILLGTENSKGFVDYVDNFLFKERTVGFSIEWLGIYYEWKFKPFYLLGTTLFVTLMGLVLVKKFVPVA